MRITIQNLLSSGVDVLTVYFRIQLLDDLGFKWGQTKTELDPECQSRQNRAIAAKLVFPQLSYEEAFLLSGFDQEELDVKTHPGDPRYGWKRVFHQNKDQCEAKLKAWDRRKGGSKPEVEKMRAILNGSDEDRYEQVFGERASFIPGFLAASEERKALGIQSESLRSRKKRKRTHEEEPEEVAMGMMEEYNDEGDLL